MHRYRSAGISSVEVLFIYNQQVAEMSLVYGFSSKGKRTLLYRGFAYIKEYDNVCGTTSWRCRYNKSLKCKARLVTDASQVVADKQPDHNHEGNMATSLARKANVSPHRSAA